MKKWLKVLLIILAVFVIVVGTLAVRENDAYEVYQPSVSAPRSSSKSPSTGNSGMPAYYADYSVALESAAGSTSSNYAPAEMPASDNGAAVRNSEKIIRTVDFTMQTTEYENTMAELRKLISAYNARIESSWESGSAENANRYASLTIRVPVEQLDAFLAGSESVAAITSISQNAEDVSESYYDTQTRLETQRAKLARLQALMEKAESIEDLIEIESAISDTQYLIDRYTGQLNSYDSKVSYSTVYAKIDEVRTVVAVDRSLGDKLISGIKGSVEEGLELLQCLLIFLFTALPWIAVIAVVVIVVVLIRKKHRAKKAAASASKDA